MRRSSRTVSLGDTTRGQRALMPYEIDFLQPGDSNGDAICMRYWSPRENRYIIHVIDGGYCDTGEIIVEHVKRYYGNPRTIDHVTLSHAHDDHVGGLRGSICKLQRRRSDHEFGLGCMRNSHTGTSTRISALRGCVIGSWMGMKLSSSFRTSLSHAIRAFMTFSKAPALGKSTFCGPRSERTSRGSPIKLEPQNRTPTRWPAHLSKRRSDWSVGPNCGAMSYCQKMKPTHQRQTSRQSFS